ncbi:MAG: hypothetical protein VKP57_11510 [Candidatus Sericytochromatia bacterium]|nr:hypothetical protein [Candidatus Sericytochromatia bacterium]
MRFGCADARHLLLDREDVRPAAADARALEVHLANCTPCRRAATSLATAMTELRAWTAELEAVADRVPRRASSDIRQFRIPACGISLAAAACLALTGLASAPGVERRGYANATAQAAGALSWLDAAADEPVWELPEP